VLNAALVEWARSAVSKPSGEAARQPDARPRAGRVPRNEVERCIETERDDGARILGFDTPFGLLNRRMVAGRLPRNGVERCIETKRAENTCSA
jgi:hypothetical protein